MQNFSSPQIARFSSIARLPWIIPICALILTLSWAGAAWAATTRTVCASGCDFTTITAAIAAASAGLAVIPVDMNNQDETSGTDRNL